MESVKLATSIGGHGPQILYTGGRQQPPGHSVGAQVVHPATTRAHEGTTYKEAISPPMVSRGGPYHSYAPVVDGSHGGGAPRYMQQHTYLTSYQREPHFVRSMSDRPVLLPHTQRRPTMMGGYGGYARTDMMPQMLPTSTMPVNTTTMDVNSCKRMKLSQQFKSDYRLPLNIDTSDTNHSLSRGESPYYPQVEAISPTLPPDPRDESPLHSTKDDLIKQIEQVDKEIALTESSIANLKKKEKELLAAAQKGEPSSQPVTEDVKEVKHQSTAQIIYAENRKRAEEGHNSLAKFNPQSEMNRVLPLYHQPSDADVYQENKRKYLTFKQVLLDHFKRVREAKSKNARQITITYSKLVADWMKKVDKYENSKKNKEKVAKSRELFEKVFPELRKQREDKERFSRVGARVKSDAEMEEIIDGIQDQENEDKKMRAYAVIPPILLDERKRRHRYINRNGHIEDAVGEYKEHKHVNIWTEHENDIFKDKYLQHPKNFIVIASYLERKSVSDCIQKYYLTKKKENYKLLVKRRMRKPRNKVGHQANVDSLVALNATSGVTTRGSAAAQKEQLMKNGPNGPCVSISASSGSSAVIKTTISGTTVTTLSNSVNDDSTVGTVNGPNVSIISGTQNWTQSASGGDANVTTTIIGSDNLPVSTNVSVSNSAVFTTVATTMASNDGPKTIDTSALVNQEVREKDKENLTVSVSVSEKLSRRERTKKEDDKKDFDSSDEDNIAEHGRGGPHDCIVCLTRLEHYGQSRAVTPSQASQYGLPETNFPPGARVCTNCKSRSFRRRTYQCPIPTCTTVKWRVKRLRPFPPRWNHLPASVKEPIVKELKIPNDVTKSCSSCHSRIIRKLGSDAEEPVDPSRWSQEDIESLRNALRELGCHWSKIAEKVKNKTQGQCKSFYYNLKGKYRLDEAISEYRKSKGKSDPPTVTDEEESGSTTSSCEEAGALPPPQHHPPPQIRHDSASDTASASSPPPPVNNIGDRKEINIRDATIKEPLPPGSSQSTTVIKEDNDSSATASADEGQNGAGRDSPEVQHIPHPGERRLNQSPLAGNSNAVSSRNSTPSAAASSGGPCFQQIIDKTVEDSIAKSRQDKLFSEKVPPTDHITITSLLQQHNTYNTKTNNRPNTNSNWNYSPVAHQPPTEQRASIPDRSPSMAYEVDCEGGLDLTVKKRERSPPPSHAQMAPHASLTSREITSVTVRGGAEVIVTGKGSPPKAHSNSISYSQTVPDLRYIQDYRKSPSVFSGEQRSLPSNMVSRVPSPNMGYGGQPSLRQIVPFPKSKSNMAPPPPLAASSPRMSHLSSLPPNANSGRLPLKTEKGALTLHGSITQGTPVNQHAIASVPISQANRFEIMSKPVMAREGGSITQGTPVHHDAKRTVQLQPSNMMKDGLIHEQRSAVEIIPSRAPTTTYEREYRSGSRPVTSVATSYPYTTFAYSTRPQYSDSQISSRQIIETDYLTSQQMMTARRGTILEKDMRIPRAREPVATVRDLRAYPPPSANLDRRAIESHSRAIDSRVDRPEHSLEFRPIDARTVSDKVQYVKTAHGFVPVHSQSPASQHYLTTSDIRVSRPSASPATVRDATPTPPSSESMAAHDFRSPGVSTSTPPPTRLNSVIRHGIQTKPTHLSPKSGSPHQENERFSPISLTRHAVIPSNLGSEPLNMVDLMKPRSRYTEARRETHPSGSHDGHQYEGLSKQVIDSLHSNRYIPGCDSQGSEREKDTHQVIHPIEIRSTDDRRYYEREYNVVRKKEEHRNVPRSNLGKEAEENEGTKIILNYPLDQNKSSPSPKNRGAPNDSFTAATLIDAIITNQIQGHIEETGRDGRVYRREGDPHGHTLSVSEADKRVRSPASNPYHVKEKEIVTVEDSSDSNHTLRHQGHKEGMAPLHSSLSHHPNLPKSSPMHMETVISREFANSEGKKIISSSSHPYNRAPLEITRTDGRPITHLNVYEQTKIRSSSVSQPHPGDKEAVSKEGYDSRSPHRLPPATSSGSHIHSGSHMVNDERQIIRIAQPPRSDNAFDFIKNKLHEIFRDSTPENPERRVHENSSGGPHARSATPSEQQQQQLHQHHQYQQQQQQLHQHLQQQQHHHQQQQHQQQQHQQQQQQHQQQQHHQQQRQPSHQPNMQSHPLPIPRNNSHYDDPIKKRPRLDLAENSHNPPLRPRSNGGDVKDSIQREDVADSPQSGEMVIDESPRGDHSVMKHGNEGSGNNQSHDKGVDRTAGRGPPSQYSNAYQSYRHHGTGSQQSHAPHSGNWGLNAPHPSSASGGRPQGYEPSVEPVSDDD